MSEQTTAYAAFTQLFGGAPAARAAAPGRVNLIGEHTDYNGGAVLPTVLPLHLEVLLAYEADDRLRAASEAHPDVVTRAWDEGPSGHWSDHLLGALRAAREVELLRGGIAAYVRSTLPAGSGLSSSAALIVATLRAAQQLAPPETPILDEVSV
ncbi:MAG: galactokinase family protein, partial [Pseudomonadota bacterium]